MSGVRRLVQRIGWALNGIGYTVKTQPNMQIHLTAAVLAVLLCLYLRMPARELAVVLVTIFMVLAAEMFNTALEAAVDLYTRKRHPLARAAKDVAAGAVLLTALNALVVAYLLIWPRFYEVIIK
ncbi:diacylglycerol kinase family protein [Desulfoscipio geothermicus]|uniref:Diacylglycerol kinase (ATP) n=1 Tax=Desulfoscipio geothermicus DSM 3669 TaxID=1121426 RepID=A0A1I6D3Z8_9FIRM|nr:diacylglycerol kinase family protein [Desulfoscipio geothermicus]SFR00110.1 diacylglycerol kinase (ATP) [Desulfoscipio geothermicus DSM 3669]